MSEALAEMLTLKRPLFVRLAARHLPHGIDPEDCVQDAAVSALRFSGDFQGRSQLSTWFGAIVINHARMSVRRMKHDISLEEPLSDGLVLSDTIPDLLPLQDRKVEWKLVIAKFNDLSPLLRVVLSLLYVDGLTFSEIANRLKLPIGTVKARSTRGKATLRKLLKIRKSIRHKCAIY